MKPVRRSREQVREDVLGLLGKLAEDWEHDQEITERTRLLGEMGLSSLDVVVLCTEVQEHYGKVLPFPELYAEIGQRADSDLSVGEWVDFIHKHLGDSEAKAS